MVELRTGYLWYDLFAIMAALILTKHGTYATDRGRIERTYLSWLDDATDVRGDNGSVEISVSHRVLDVSKGYIANLTYIGKWTKTVTPELSSC